MGIRRKRCLRNRKRWPLRIIKAVLSDSIGKAELGLVKQLKKIIDCIEKQGEEAANGN